MHGQIVVPLSEIQLNDVDHDLKRHDDDLEVQVEDKVALLDTILFCDDGLLVEDPEQGDEEHGVEERDVVVRIALKLTQDIFNLHLDEPVFDRAFRLFLLFLLRDRDDLIRAIIYFLAV